MDRVGNRVAIFRSVMTPARLRTALTCAVALPVLMAGPTSAAAQRRDGGGEQAGTAVSRPSSPAPAPAPAPAPPPSQTPATASGDSRRGAADRPNRSGDTSTPNTG